MKVHKVVSEPCLFVFVGPLSVCWSENGFGITFSIASKVESNFANFESGVLMKKKVQHGERHATKARIQCNNFALIFCTIGNCEIYCLIPLQSAISDTFPELFLDSFLGSLCTDKLVWETG